MVEYGNPLLIYTSRVHQLGDGRVVEAAAMCGRATPSDDQAPGRKPGGRQRRDKVKTVRGLKIRCIQSDPSVDTHGSQCSVGM